MWIEILTDDVSTGGKIVALRKESVDRNEYIRAGTGILNLSLSARRVWIEICFWCIFYLYEGVALRKESVDRNNYYR